MHIKGEEFTIYYEKTSDAPGDKTGSAKATVASVSAGTATVTATLTDAKAGGGIDFYYPYNHDYPGTNHLTDQVGTLADINSNFACMYGSGTMNVSGNTVTIDDGGVVMTQEISIWKFTFSDGSNDITSDITSLQLAFENNTYDVNPTSQDAIYVAIYEPFPFTTGPVTITATTASGIYSATKSSVTLQVGKMYSSSVVLSAAPVASFSVSATKQVYFSKGNLQYQASTDTWRFAEHQYDYVGNAAGNNTSSGRDTQSGWIDLFGWGTSGKTFASGYGTANQPWATSTTNNQYGPTNGTSDLTDDYANGDWGVNMGTGWRTLTSGEWTYLLNTRGGTRYCKATVNSKTGLVIFPDSYSHPAGVTAVESANTTGAAFTTNSWSGEDWTKMETAGAVFLPAAGFRNGTSVIVVGSNGYYWSSTHNGNDNANGLNFSSFSVSSANSSRSYGSSVRLVKDVVTP